MKTLLRYVFRCVIGLLLLVVVLFAGLAFLKIPIDLTRFKTPVELIVAQALGRPVRIEKSVVMSTSLKPVFTLSGLRIGNPEGFSQDTFMYLDTAHIQVELVPLLKRKIHITDISVRKLGLTLEERADGAVNWIFSGGTPAASPTAEKEKATTETTRDKFVPGEMEISADTIVVKDLHLEDISVHYYGPGENEPFRYQIEKCSGTMLPGTPLKLDITGSILSFPYSLAISIASLDKLLKENRSWMGIEAEIAATRLSFGGDINLATARRALALKASVEGENLSSLNDLFDLDLPPLKNYGVDTTVRMEKHHFELKNLTAKAGSSRLVGSADIKVENDTYKAEIDFRAPLIQLDDFMFDNWSWQKGETTDAATPEASEKNDAKPKEGGKQGEETKEPRALTDLEVLGKIDGRLTIQADQVLSGRDELGSGTFTFSLKDCRAAIDPLDLNIPGGSIKMSASFVPGTEASEASLKAVIKNFDIGIWVRRARPEAKMSGLVNLDVDLKSSAASIDQLLDNGSGYFDFSGQLNNMKAGIIDLWAVNLVASIVSSTAKDQSQINCAVGRWSVNDGLLTPDVFFIDTSRIRICGTGQVDFKKDKLDLIIAPTAKRPESFSLATPMRVKGSFEDIKLGIQPGGVAGTAARFVVSPITVPIERLVSDDIPQDGSDACTVTLGPDNRSETKVRGCN